MGKYLFLAFTLIPLIELYLLLAMGRQFGFWPTVGSVLLTGVLGTVLARREGMRVLREWQGSLSQGRVPEEGILGGVLVLVGGVLLVAPGVLTDVTGLLLLFPPTRKWVAAGVRRVLERRVASGRVRVSTFQVGSFGGPADSRPRTERLNRAAEDAEFTEDSRRER